MFIYVFHCSGYRKVGIAANVEARRLSLQAACPYPILLVYSFDLSGLPARTIERRAHFLLDHHLHRNEWFRCNKAIAIKAIEQAIQEASTRHRDAMRAQFSEATIENSASPPFLRLVTD